MEISTNVIWVILKICLKKLQKIESDQKKMSYIYIWYFFLPIQTTVRVHDALGSHSYDIRSELNVDIDL